MRARACVCARMYSLPIRISICSTAQERNVFESETEGADAVFEGFWPLRVGEKRKSIQVHKYLTTIDGSVDARRRLNTSSIIIAVQGLKASK